MVAFATDSYDHPVQFTHHIFFRLPGELVHLHDILMNSLIKLLTIFLLVVTSSTLTYIALSSIAEKFFFDKLIYEKRVDYGYRPPNRENTLEQFGARSRDLISLETDSQDPARRSVLGVSDDPEEFTIAIIGDSYVWGTGVKFDDTVSRLLEKKLGNYRKVKVLTLGEPGYSTLDYLMLYEKARELYSIDLFIFPLVDNDALLMPWRADEYSKHEVWKWCQQYISDTTAVFEFTSEEYNSFSNSKDRDDSQRVNKHDKSWQTPFNLCLMDKSLDLLPSNKAIYLVSQFDHKTNQQWDTYIGYLNSHNKFILYVDEAKKLKQFKPFWQNPKKNFWVSPSESHPSKIMHKIYSELLFQEIIGNPIWGFEVK